MNQIEFNQSTLKGDDVPFDSSNDEVIFAYKEEIKLLKRKIEQLKKTADYQVDKGKC